MIQRAVTISPRCGCCGQLPCREEVLAVEPPMCGVMPIVPELSQTACPHCGAAIRPAISSQGHPFLSCVRFPRCAHTVGIDALTATRMRTHSIFDQLWKGEKRIMTRTAAYAMLRRILQVPEERAHIGRLSRSECGRLIEGLRGIVEFDP